MLLISRPCGRLIDASPGKDNGFSGGSGSAVGWTDDGQPLEGAASEFGLDFERALSDKISRRIPANCSSSTEEAAPTCSADFRVCVLSGKQDTAGENQMQSSAESEENSTAAGLQDQATSSVDAVDKDADSNSTGVF